MTSIIELLIEERDKINKALAALGYDQPPLNVENLNKAIGELKRQHGRLSITRKRLVVRPGVVASLDRSKRTWSPEARQKQATGMKRHLAKRRIEAAQKAAQKAVRKTKKTK